MATVVRSFAIQGIDGYPVDIEIKMLEGQPSISIIGLGDQAVKEAVSEWRYRCKKTARLWVYRRIITGWKTEGMQGNPANDHSRTEKGNKEDHCSGSEF